MLALPTKLSSNNSQASRKIALGKVALLKVEGVGEPNDDICQLKRYTSAKSPICNKNAKTKQIPLFQYPYSNSSSLLRLRALTT